MREIPLLFYVPRLVHISIVESERAKKNLNDAILGNTHYEAR